MWSEVLRQLRVILDRRTKVQLLLATSASILLAILDMVAIVLVLPLVTLSTGSKSQSGVSGVLQDLLGNPDRQTLVLWLTLAVVGLFIVKDLGAIALNYWLAGFKAFNQVRLSSRVLRHFLTMPYTLVSRRSSAQMIRTMMDAVSQVFGSVVFGVMSMVANVTAIVAVMLALLVSAPGPAIAVAIYFGAVAALFMKVIKPRAAAAGTEAARAAEGSWRTAFAALGGIKELKLRGTQDFFVEQYEVEAARGARAVRSREILSGTPRYLLEILFIVGIGLILLTSGAATSQEGGSQTVGLTALFVAAGFRMLPSITGLMGNVSVVRFGAQYLEIVHQEIVGSRPPTLPSRPDSTKLPFRHEIQVRDVDFRYPDGAGNALTGVTLSIRHGRSLALVGGSGAGKTTLVDVVLGLHQPTGGRVLVDGADVAHHTREWQQNIAYVPQDVYLLDATLAENVAFDQALTEIDSQLLEQAIGRAQLGELVSQLPLGVHSQIGEKGSRLSGGQRQRVGIARALYRQPDLLVLDEATSALDNETEHRINQTIQDLHGSITVLVVAHRLSTVRHSDQVVFMKEGRVEDVGSFDELRLQNAEFDRLVRLGSLELSAEATEPVETPRG